LSFFEVFLVVNCLKREVIFGFVDIGGLFFIMYHMLNSYILSDHFHRKYMVRWTTHVICSILSDHFHRKYMVRWTTHVICNILSDHFHRKYMVRWTTHVIFPNTQTFLTLF
jgi:hypothetical protein